MSDRPDLDEAIKIAQAGGLKITGGKYAPNPAKPDVDEILADPNCLCSKKHKAKIKAALLELSLSVLPDKLSLNTADPRNGYKGYNEAIDLMEHKLREAYE